MLLLPPLSLPTLAGCGPLDLLVRYLSSVMVAPLDTLVVASAKGSNDRTSQSLVLPVASRCGTHKHYQHNYPKVKILIIKKILCIYITK